MKPLKQLKQSLKKLKQQFKQFEQLLQIFRKSLQILKQFKQSLKELNQPLVQPKTVFGLTKQICLPLMNESDYHLTYSSLNCQMT